MEYQTYKPHPDLDSLVSCYWTLEVPASPDAKKQRIVPDGCIEMAFILGDDVMRYTSETDFVIQPRAMVLGQITKPFYIEPTGYVYTFAIRFFPYGFSCFIESPIESLVDKETPIGELFGATTAKEFEQSIIQASSVAERIEITESFLLSHLLSKDTIDKVVKMTIEALLLTNGSAPIITILKGDQSKRRQLERKFSKQIGVSPKQLGKVIRMQTALKMLLDQKKNSFTSIAYESGYYDQAHFIKDFREFTGTSPKEFLGSENLALSMLFYK